MCQVSVLVNVVCLILMMAVYVLPMWKMDVGPVHLKMVPSAMLTPEMLAGSTPNLIPVEVLTPLLVVVEPIAQAECPNVKPHAVTRNI